MEDQQAKQNLNGNLQKRRRECKLSNTFISSEWIEPRSITSRIVYVIVRVRVALKRTVVGD